MQILSHLIDLRLFVFVFYLHTNFTRYFKFFLCSFRFLLNQMHFGILTQICIFHNCFSPKLKMWFRKFVIKQWCPQIQQASASSVVLLGGAVVLWCCVVVLLYCGSCLGSLGVTTCLLVAWGSSSGSDCGSVAIVVACLSLSPCLPLFLSVYLYLCVWLTGQANNATETTKTKCLCSSLVIVFQFSFEIGTLQLHTFLKCIWGTVIFNIQEYQ